MKKVLIILTKLYMGGFSKSLINFLLCAERRKDISFSLLFLDDEMMELEKDIPNNVEITRVHNPEFITGLVDKSNLFFHKCKYVFFEKWYSMFFREEIPSKYVTEYAQMKNLIKARSLKYDFSFTKEFDAIISWEEGYCNYVLTESIPDNKKIGFIHPNYREAHFSKRVDYNSLKKLDKIITISQSCHETLCEIFPRFEGKISYIPNRLNYRNLCTKAHEYMPEIDKDCFSMLTVARIVDHDKAVFRIVKLARELKSSGLLFKWYVIGNGSDFEEMQKRVQANNVADCVILLGEITNPCPYMKNVDLFVMQSHREGRPVAVDEALLLGTPALITEYSSAHEQIKDSHTGWIVEDDFDSVYRKIYEILSNNLLISEVKDNVGRLDKTAYEDCSGLIYAIFE